MLENAHIRSMGAALMRARAALSLLICREDKSATVGHDNGGVEGMSGAKSATESEAGLLGFSRDGERLSETVQECREARQLL